MSGAESVQGRLTPMPVVQVTGLLTVMALVLVLILVIVRTFVPIWMVSPATSRSPQSSMKYFALPTVNVVPVPGALVTVVSGVPPLIAGDVGWRVKSRLAAFVNRGFWLLP